MTNGVICPASLAFLGSEAGERLLAEVPLWEGSDIRILTRLRRQLPAELAAAVWETVVLRGRAAGKFERAERMLFTRTGLEESSSEACARWRARRFARHGCQRIAELCCGVGGDSLALSAVAEVMAVDLDPVHAALARHNVAVYGAGASFTVEVGDLEQHEPWAVDAFFCDPERRDSRGKRQRSVRFYRPGLALLERWWASVPAGAVKVSPAIAATELPGSGVEVEFVSVAGELKEAVWWSGGLAEGVRRRATVLPAEVSLTDEEAALPVSASAPREILYEPDPAVLRAGLVQLLAQRLGAAQLDPTIAFLTAPEPQATPLARAFEVLHWRPFALDPLRRELRQRQIGRLTIKRRGSGVDPEELTRRLRLRGDASAVLFLTRLAGRPIAILGKPLAATSGR